MEPLTDQEKPEIRPLLTIIQLCGIFSKDRKGVEELGIPRIVLAVGDYRYRQEDVEEFIASRIERF